MRPATENNELFVHEIQQSQEAILYTPCIVNEEQTWNCGSKYSSWAIDHIYIGGKKSFLLVSKQTEMNKSVVMIFISIE